jgi:cytochrome c biogenesis protein CcdA/thiol-disulfide isomerase/thioredoxin
MYLLLIYSCIAGFFTVLSPCILPVLPLLLAAGAQGGKYRPYGIIAGLFVSFVFFTLSLTALVRATGISANFLHSAAIVFIIFFGCVMLFPALGRWFDRAMSRVVSWGSSLQTTSFSIKTDFVSGFVLGIALGLIWTPCAGPILASVIVLVATSAITWKTVAITIAYSLGATIPMFLIIYGGNKLVYSTGVLSPYSELIRKFFGIIMILVGLAMAFHVDTLLQQQALRYLPFFTIENNPKVIEELENTMPQKKQLESETLKAPDFAGIQEWINSPPLTIRDLRGKVVLVDFWTYSCINCIRTLPYLKQWYQAYKDKGFTIIGVHTPEFQFEKNAQNVKAAAQRFGITYPIPLDNDYKTWQNYTNHYWPAHYLIDQNGFIRQTHFGEGGYTETENAIRSLLGLSSLPEGERAETVRPLTPETYLGSQRADRYQPGMYIQPHKVANYEYQGTLIPHHVGLKGEWLVGSQSITAQKDASLLLHFAATHVYLVMESPTPQEVTVLLDGKPLPQKYYTADVTTKGTIPVHEPRMYSILDLKDDYGQHILTLNFPKNVTAYAFTFG